MSSCLRRPAAPSTLRVLAIWTSSERGCCLSSRRCMRKKLRGWALLTEADFGVGVGLVWLRAPAIDLCCGRHFDPAAWVQGLLRAGCVATSVEAAATLPSDHPLSTLARVESITGVFVTCRSRDRGFGGAVA